MKNKKWFFVVIVVVFGVVIGFSLYLLLRPHYATTYEDAGGWVYSCTQPIEVKDQGVTYMNGKPSLTPVNEAEAAAYCHEVGIE